MVVQNNPIYLPYTEIKKYQQIFKDYGYEFMKVFNSKDENYYLDKRLYAMIEHKDIGFCVNIVPLYLDKKHWLQCITYPEKTIFAGKEYTSYRYYCDYVENENDCIKKVINQIVLLKKQKQYRELEKIKIDF